MTLTDVLKWKRKSGECGVPRDRAQCRECHARLHVHMPPNLDVAPDLRRVDLTTPTARSSDRRGPTAFLIIVQRVGISRGDLHCWECDRTSDHTTHKTAVDCAPNPCAKHTVWGSDIQHAPTSSVGRQVIGAGPADRVV